MPTEWWLRLVNNTARVGEQSAVQDGGTDGGELASLPALLSLEEPATWLVGA
jgi:hypothetical protein